MAKIMNTFERNLWNLDIQYVAGVDEVGRGPLVGPVVAAAVIFDREADIPDGINDSKKLSAPVRNKLFEQIRKAACAIGIGIVEKNEIDSINILQATFKAMRAAVEQLDLIPEHILVDGSMTPEFNSPSTAVIKGDSKSFSIAAASIIAKVTRDNIMIDLDDLYPAYGFKSNKGYGTQFHIDVIKEHGLTPEHRVTFCRKFVNPQFTVM